MNEVPLYLAGTSGGSWRRGKRTRPPRADRATPRSKSESGSLRAVHLSRHKWPGRLANQDLDG